MTAPLILFPAPLIAECVVACGFSRSRDLNLFTFPHLVLITLNILLSDRFHKETVRTLLTEFLVRKQIYIIKYADVFIYIIILVFHFVNCVLHVKIQYYIGLRNLLGCRMFSAFKI